MGYALDCPTSGVAETDQLFEYLDGEPTEVPRMGALAGVLASILSQFLNAHAMPGKLGFAVVEVLFHLRDDLQERRPDVAFIPLERWPITAVPTEDPRAWPTVPSLAVEIISPTNTIDDTEGKLADYFAAGVQLVWVMLPVRRRVYVYASVTDVRILTEHDTLEGGAALPGFRLGIADLFAALVLPT